MNRASKQEALKLWNQRHFDQLAFIKMVLDNRHIDHNIHDVKRFNATQGKIVFQYGQSTYQCFLTDNCLTFKDLELVLELEELALWLDS
ncbi:hypothetical protein EM59_016465 [Vibrio parahaemolyticus]|nr:hypothetical protein EM59_016465 [Vibrio parahaemolyticus]